MTDVFDDLLAGPDSVKTLRLRDGRPFLIRSGSRSERNKIEKKFENYDFIMDAIATLIFFRAANEDGSPRFAGRDFKKFAETLDYDLATEVATLVRKMDSPNEDDDFTLDEKTESQLKNSKRQKEAT